jgi:NAD(P) transhydrogenase subunit alpha
LTRAGETVEVDGVRIIGPVNIASTVPFHASQMFSRNVVTLLRHLITEGALTVDPSDEIVSPMLLGATKTAHQREDVHA